ncbi:MAG: hypothetical protein KF718_32150 [Polyangiaceae bacterium]|nr:hypothetical protein [Polyangiaceae bacterium]
MRQIVPTGDERVLAACIYCGAAPDTRDHVPSRVLLDEPFPENLPVVPSCRACNTSFSLDEEYLAVLIDCVIVGATTPTSRHRAKVRRILKRQPALAAAIHAGCTSEPTMGTTVFAADLDRVKKVVLKLAKGHAAFELHTVEDEEPSAVSIVPLQLLDENSREAFETPPHSYLFPEMGSRAMMRMFEHGVPSPSWIVVQSGRYRFLASPGRPLLVRMVIGEYLACEVAWDV